MIFLILLSLSIAAAGAENVGHSAASVDAAHSTLRNVSATAASTRVPSSSTPLAEERRAPEKRVPTTRRQVVALDIGHTLDRPGAISATGATEFSFNKRIVQLLADQLRRSARIEPRVINPSGAPISLPARTAKARGADLFLSIHHDSVQAKYLVPWTVAGKRQFYSDDFHGYGVFVSQKNVKAAASFAFARLLGGEMARQGFEFSPHHSEPVAGENRQIIDKYHGVYRYDDLIVLKTAAMPAVLLECGVIVNRAEEKLLKEAATQEKIVRAIVAALEQYFESHASP